MDIAADSITPNDAPPAPPQPPLIKREDYTPYPWLVPQTALHFDLGLEETKVTARLTIEPNPAAEPNARAAAEWRWVESDLRQRRW